ncbi:hypothetical protein TRFO_28304 [Tritrichomonas foetus]|uniref:Uncharacterized protein n=1 Tax=Tritrichomonas foetus TaxID=1144522 RepID=A0A1J4K434_9EUKA|nr:hypothetical protein TRFO_28304 [Tritrichomonas foetus]|eukprot:OHT04253.1 hypothetical protein TRFO_28304 [Tritrichomonas foetus]
MKKSRKPIEPQKVDNFEFSASDFQIPQLAEDEEEPLVKQTPVKPTQQKQASQGQVSARKQATNNSNKDDKNDEIGMPKKLEQSPSKRQSQIPVSKRSHPDLPPDADVLERSLHVKFSFKDDTFSKPPQKASHVKWYEDDAFDKVEEPDFSFELMMTAEGEDPVFCIDGDYYDSSGRMLSVQQGKGKVIFVTEDGYETNETDE